MEKLKPPSAMSFADRNLAEAWRRWENQFRIYFQASELDKKSPATQTAILLHVAGPDAQDIYQTFTFAAPTDEQPDPRNDVEVVLKQFGTYCNPRRNTVYERHRFWSRDQADGETIDQWVTELKTRAASCEFGDQRDLLIRDKIVFGIRDERIKERLLRESGLTLTKALDLCRAAEATKEQVQAMNKEAPQIPMRAIRGAQHPRRGKADAKPTARILENDKPFKAKQSPCRYCGGFHQPRQCPAYGKACSACYKKNHLAKVCLQAARQTKQVALLQDDDDTSSDDAEGLFLAPIFVGRIRDTDEWTERLDLGCTQVDFKLDTGAHANVLPFQVYNVLKTRMHPTNKILTGIGQGKITPRGTTLVECSVSRRQLADKKRLTFYVTDQDLAILGKAACEELDLIRRVDSMTPVSIHSSPTRQLLIDRNKDVFKGIGQYDKEYHIQLQPGAIPVVQHPRIIPYAKRAKLRQTVAKLQQQGIIQDVEGPTEWLHNLVITEKKDGRMRLCLDPRPLNKVIKRERHQIPTMADVQARLAGKAVFTVVDMKDAFWHVKLSDESARLCAFSTPWGRKCFTRMPFGLASASEVLQERNDRTFGDLPNVHVIADDLIVAGENEKEHDVALAQVLHRARERNVRFSPQKLQYKVPQVRYMGHILSQQGQQPDPEKIEAISNMPKPQDKQAVQRLLGMIKFLAPYIPNESDITAPLRDLIKEGNAWQWDTQQDEALSNIKRALTSGPVLAFYDPEQPVTIQADASQSGLGACLLQHGKPIAYASRTLTSPERAYAQIEKEMLALTYGCKKFHPYVYGKTIDIETDHKPLESIMKKPLGAAPPRLQRMMLQVQKYDLAVRYVPGTQMFAADTLSRAPLPNSKDVDPELTGDMEIMVHAFMASLPCSAKRKEHLQQAVSTDDELQCLTQQIQRGWPQKVEHVPPPIRSYWTIRDELHQAEGLLFKGKKIIIPAALRPDMLKITHESHQGLERSKERARAVMYWPGMTKDIERVIGQCPTCLRFRKSNIKEPLCPHPVPTRPWEKLGTDIMTLKAKDYLLVADYYSKYVELKQLPDKTSPSIINAMKVIFSTHGIPDEVISDNMPFASRDMATFAKEWGFTITTSSPGYPQSNGFAERNVQTVKNLLKKTLHEGGDPHLALLNLRSTPIPQLQASPAQLLMGRTLKTRLPAAPALLQPQEPRDITAELAQRQHQQKHYHDRAAHSSRELHPGEVVRVQRGKEWEPAIVLERHDSPRSYLIRQQGRVLRRNRRHLHPSTEPVSEAIKGPDSLEDADADDTEDDCSGEPADADETEETPPLQVTRSGRQVKRPARLDDYVT